MMGGGMGFGGGGGRGRGRGRGKGTGRGMGMGTSLGPSEPRPENLDQEVEILRAQTETIMAQLHDINTRISEIQRGKVSTLAGVADAQSRKEKSIGTEREIRIAVVDLERCAGCCICAEACPEGAITVENTAMIDPHKCTGCGSCIDECPTEAIALTGLHDAAS